MEQDCFLTTKKAALRKQARQWLATQCLQTVQSWGASMAAPLFELPAWQQAKTVFCFVSTPSEPDTTPILKAVLSSGRTLCVPRTLDVHGHMEAVPIENLDQLSAGRWGILEPPAHLSALPADQLDLIVAPCLMAGPNGARLGQGGGYYDRFFAQCNCPTVALCPSGLVHPNLPLEPFDHRVDFVLTESGWIP